MSNRWTDSGTVPGGAPPPRQERWTKTDTWLFVSFALGYTLEAYIFALAPVATGWVKEPASLRSLLLAWAPIWLVVGIAIAGPLGDWLGRRRTFYLTMCAYGVGAVGLYFASSYVVLLAFLALLLAAAGGEMNMLMVAVHEMMPTRHRSKAALLSVNFINLGGVVIASVDLVSGSGSAGFQRAMVASALLGVLLVLLFVRRLTPESPRWLVRKRRADDAARELMHFYGPEEVAARRLAVKRAQERSARRPATQEGQRTPRRYPPVWLRITAVVLLAFTDTTGFGLLTYTLGPVHFPHLVADIILVTTLAGFASGFMGLWADRLSRRWLLVVGYGGALALTGVAWATESTWARDLALFWGLLVVINVFSNVAYISEDTLKGEVWPTRYRARFTALCRFLSIGGYIGTIYWTEHFSTQGLIFFNLLVWALGFVAALAWFFWGVETAKGTAIETASGHEGSELLELPIDLTVPGAYAGAGRPAG